PLWVDAGLVLRVRVRHHHADLRAQVLFVEAEGLGSSAREIDICVHSHGHLRIPLLNRRTSLTEMDNHGRVFVDRRSGRRRWGRTRHSGCIPGEIELLQKRASAISTARRNVSSCGSRPARRRWSCVSPTTYSMTRNSASPCSLISNASRPEGGKHLVGPEPRAWLE